MNDHALRIPKKLQPVTLWVHPEGRVVGSIFLHLQSNQQAGEEKPQEILNHSDPFLVLKYDDPDSCRFYNKRSIVRAQYHEDNPQTTSEIVQLSCCLHMMDGSLLKGVIREFLPPEHSRLYDYINIDNEPFLKLHVDDQNVCLVNKSYIVRVTPDDESAFPGWTN